MPEATPITVTLKLTRETKNTYRYDAADEDAPVGFRLLIVSSP